jgi:hypothetical protein
MEVATKVCTKSTCIHQGKPQFLSNFYKNASHSTGYRSVCKDCDRAYLEEYHSRPRTYIQVEMLICSNPDCKNPGPKSVDNFYKQWTNKTGYRPMCKDCTVQERTNKREQYLEYERHYMETHPGYNNYKASIYRAAKLQATPPWVDFDKIKEIYEEADRLSKETGEIYVVDHIVPLNHPLVCGLHVPWNLQILTFSENSKKSNKLIL